MNSNSEQRLLTAWAEHQKGRVDFALAEYRSVLEAEPNSANGWCYLGIALHDKKQYEKSVDAYSNAIKLQPKFPIAWNNMGNSLRYLSKFDLAEQAFATALEQNPRYANAFKNRAALRATQGWIEVACKDYEEALSLQPNDPELHRNIGVLKLLLGEFNDGWLEYRWRWQCKEAACIKTNAPKWDGSSLQGKKILLYSEQGLGDTMQFIRYVKVAKQLGADKVFVYAQAVLSPLLRDFAGIDRWFDEFNPINDSFDVHCSLLDCADLLDTNLSNIPSFGSYIQPAKYLVDYWAEYFRSFEPTRLKVGIAWQGNPDHQADQFRSVHLSFYRPILEQANVDFFALQRGFGLEQIQGLGFSDRIQSFPDGTDQSSGAFMDTAAIMSHLDLIITSDTSIAHLAGAIGRPTWLLLNVMPDWRWLLHRKDSPWYPSMQLFRQQQPGDWANVVKDVVLQLSEFQATSLEHRT